MSAHMFQLYGRPNDGEEFELPSGSIKYPLIPKHDLTVLSFSPVYAFSRQRERWEYVESIEGYQELKESEGW